ncbi:unnamed protein product [Rotaria socialis]|uniref:Integrase catalytic domain-containing protein n=1 Tax=Rotaria socialis TaxID=392032 RepID=A0A821W9I5_9BILA|nr:unnamed protein product [Rotaria socialis]
MGVVAYIDDMLIWGQTRDGCVKRTHIVLQRLIDNNLRGKLSKCVKLNESRVNTIQSWQVLSPVKQMQKFLGFVNFCSDFVMNFSILCRPMFDMLKGKPATLTWTKVTLLSFRRIQDALTKAPLLNISVKNGKYQLEADASDRGLGSILTQQCENGRIMLFEFYSQSLTDHEKNYTTLEKELLAVHDSLKYWRHLLEGAAQPIAIFTDHKILKALKHMRVSCSRHIRWLEFISRFNVSITYRPGKLQPMPIPKAPWESYGVDIVNSIGVNNQNVHSVAVLVDRFSKLVITFAYNRAPKFTMLWNDIKNHVFVNVGNPNTLLTDRGQSLEVLSGNLIARKQY